MELNSGDSLIMKCDNFVNNWLENKDNSLTEVIIFQLNHKTIQFAHDNKVPEFIRESATVESSSLQKIQSNNLLIRFAKEISQYIDQPEMMKEELIRVKTRELLFLLTEIDQDASIKNVLASLFDHIDYNFKQIIEANVFENLNLEDLAFMTSLSLSSFQRKFKELFETTPRKYINLKRLEKAKHMLENPNMRISDIAYSCGFQDVAYFSNTFSTTYSISPRSYRKRVLE